MAGGVMAREPDRCTRLMNREEVRQEIHFGLGQAGLQVFIDIHSKDRAKREGALNRLADKVADRFERHAVYSTPPRGDVATVEPDPR